MSVFKRRRVPAEIRFLVESAAGSVSPDFLASKYISNNELPRMLQAAESDGMTIFWIPVRPSPYKHSLIGAFQAAHAPEKPLSGLSNAERDQAFVDIGEEMAKALGIAAG